MEEERDNRRRKARYKKELFHNDSQLNEKVVWARLSAVPRGAASPLSPSQGESVPGQATPRNVRLGWERPKHVGGEVGGK